VSGPTRFPTRLRSPLTPSWPRQSTASSSARSTFRGRAPRDWEAPPRLRGQARPDSQPIERRRVVTDSLGGALVFIGESRDLGRGPISPKHRAVLFGHGAILSLVGFPSQCWGLVPMSSERLGATLVP
jgi:hypothetical protein